MLCVVSEDTERVIGERRMATLRDHGSDPRVVRTEEEMLAFAAWQFNRKGQDFRSRRSTCSRATAAPDSPRPQASRQASLRRRPPSWPMSRPDVATGAPGVDGRVPRRSRECRTTDRVWPLPPNQALVVPLLRQGDAPYGFMVAGLAGSTYRRVPDRGPQRPGAGPAGPCATGWCACGPRFSSVRRGVGGRPGDHDRGRHKRPTPRRQWTMPASGR